MHWRRSVVVGVLVLSGLPGVARAESEVDILLNKLVEKGVLSNVEAGQIRREITETKDARNQQLAKDIVPDSARNWKWKGDLRLRDEVRNRSGGGGGQRDLHRQRIRFRYGFEGKVNDQLKVNARIATGTATDPVSTNQTFNTFLLKKAVFLDLANAVYTPEVPGLTRTEVIGGIFENPLWTVGPMVWDQELSFDGAAIKLSRDIGTTGVSVFSNNGVITLDSDETEPATIWLTQLGTSIMPFASSEQEVLQNLKVTGAIAYHDYMNVANSAKAGTDPVTREAQNSAFGAGGLSDFNQLNPAVELATMVAEIPGSISWDWIHNAGAGSAVNDGFQVGVKMGKATVPWSLKKGWETGYFYQQLQQDAVFDEFADSDFNDGGTNNHGHAFWVTLATLKNSTLGAKAYLARTMKGTAKDLENRFQLDWVTKF